MIYKTVAVLAVFAVSIGVGIGVELLNAHKKHLAEATVVTLVVGAIVLCLGTAVWAAVVFLNARARRATSEQ